MSSFEKVKPGMRPRFLSQKMDANDPEKNIPSTAAKATRRSAKVESLSAIQRRAHSALALMQGTICQRGSQVGKSTGLDCIEEVSSLRGFFDIGVNQERVGLRMDILHHDLEAIETSGFRDLHFIAESFEKILIDNTVRSSKEGEDVRDEELFIRVETMFPIVKILRQINFLGSPEGCLSFLIHLPDLKLD
jgi:hypothetical protein